MKNSTKPLDVSVLYTAGCAGTPPTIALIEGVSKETGIPVRLREILVESPDQAVELRFLGSPTVQVNGVDVDAAARDSTDFGFM
jgi:hypothetical protein